MKLYNVKIKMLTYGFLPLKDEYKIDDYVLKYDKINELDVVSITKNTNFSTANYIYFCSFESDTGVGNCYSFFENEKFIQVKLRSNTDDKNKILHNIIYNTPLLSRVYSLEKKLRLIFNVRILLPISVVEVYNQSNEYIGKYVYYQTLPGEFGIKVEDIQIFERNSQFFINMESLDDFEKKNFKFNKAMKYYYYSFDSNDISLRFVNLFSSMEALFISGRDNKLNIAEHLAVRISRLLFYDNDSQKKLYDKLKKLYSNRSKYLHGSNLNVITLEMEKELRELVRYALIIYWLYSYSNSFCSNQILTKLDNNAEIDTQIKTMTKYLMSDDFSVAYKESCELIASEIDKGICRVTEENNGIIKAVEEISSK